MNNNSDNDKRETNKGNDGFIWSQRATVVLGFVFALALAAAKFSSVLAVPLDWGRLDLITRIAAELWHQTCVFRITGESR